MRLKNRGGQTFVLDLVRKKWLVLSPEEFVRQHVLNFFINEKKYPTAFIAVEKELQLNDVKKRYDIVVYNKMKEPYLLVECKAPYIELDRTVVDQALRYNLVLKAPLLMISNGISDLVFTHESKASGLPDQIPGFD